MTNTPPHETRGIDKIPTGINGLDEITNGGLPRGRPTLLCGGAGCGKTLFSVEFLVRGAVEFGEPGVFLAFEENSDELAANVRSLGFDLKKLIRQKKLLVDFVQIERGEVLEGGEYDLDGLFIRLGHAIDSIGAKRVVLDTLESLFGGLPNEMILRSELRRLFRWLKAKGVTAIVTAERGDGALTRQGMEEYVSDCVILLDHRVNEQVATRRLRVVKYRGTAHGTNEYPFIIDERGVEVVPVTSVGLNHSAADERIETGIPELDAMLGGSGLYRGSTALVSGTTGTGKTSVACKMAEASCRRGERVLYFAFEESSDQIRRNMRSIGIDLKPFLGNDLLLFRSARPTLCGLESHLVAMFREIREYKPRMVVVDPASNFLGVANTADVKSMLLRLVDFLKTEHITAVFTSLTTAGRPEEATTTDVSSIVDSWVILRDLESNGERNRVMYVLKSRGMANSNQLREFHLSKEGIHLTRPYFGAQGVLTGSARLAQESRETAAVLQQHQETERKMRVIEQKRLAVEAQIAALRTAFELEADELRQQIGEEQELDDQRGRDQEAMATSRRSGGSKRSTSAPRLRVGRRSPEASS